MKGFSLDFWLVICAMGAMGLALSTLLPWYGVGPCCASGGISAISSFLSPYTSPLTITPGHTDWGVLMIVASGITTALVVLACIDVQLQRRRSKSRPIGAWVLLLLVVIASTGLVALTIAELLARPLIGDGPFLAFEWGALVGVSAALVATLSSCLAFAKWVAETRSVGA